MSVVFRMNDLSMIVEATASQETRMAEKSQTNNQSGDSGLASSSNSSMDSTGTNLIKNTGCLIIQFQALNAGSKGAQKESTFVMNKHSQNETCNVSRIDGSKNKETLNSDDGKEK